MKKSLIVVSLLMILTACNDKSNDQAVKEAVKTALEEERLKQQLLEAQKQQAQPQVQPIIIQQPTPKPIVVEQTSPQPIVVEKQTKNRHYIMTQNDGYVFMRSEPYAEARKILKLEDNTPVNVIECSQLEYRSDVNVGNTGSWCKVEAKGQIGYVFDSYMKPLL